MPWTRRRVETVKDGPFRAPGAGPCVVSEWLPVWEPPRPREHEFDPLGGRRCLNCGMHVTDVVMQDGATSRRGRGRVGCDPVRANDARIAREAGWRDVGFYWKVGDVGDWAGLPPESSVLTAVPYYPHVERDVERRAFLADLGHPLGR